MGNTRKSGWVAAVAALTLTACDDGQVSSPEDLTILGVAIAPDSGMIDAIAGRVKLTAHVDAADAAESEVEPPIEWVSLDSAVATVDVTGEVTAVGAGRTRVAATVLEVADTAAVVVKQAVAAVEIGLATARTGEGAKDGSAEERAIGPRPAKALFARANGSGDGNGGSTEESTLVLGPLTVLLPEDTVRLVATARDRNGYEIRRVARPKWKSLDPAVAKIDASGLLRVVGEGVTSIIARIEGYADTALVRTQRIRRSVNISVDSVAFNGIGQTIRLTATVHDRKGNEIPDARVTWMSLDSTIATVDSMGVVTAKMVGLGLIVASAAETAPDTVTIVVDAPVAEVRVTPDSAEIEVGETVQLTATALDAFGNTLPNHPCTWFSSSPNVATVDTAGLVTGVAGGSTTITASIDGVRDSATVTVVADAPAVAEVRVTPESPQIEVGETVQLTATAFDSTGNTLPDRTGSWTSSEPNVATVDGSGLVTGVAEGSATITATIDEVQDNAEVTVTRDSSPGDGLLFADDFESYPVDAAADRSQDIHGQGANGFVWGTGGQNTYVSDAEAFSGTKSFAMLYRGDPGDPSGDASSQRRFVLAADAASAPDEVWIEYMLRVPDNWEHRDATGATGNKLLAVWSEFYDNREGDAEVILEWGRGTDTESHLDIAVVTDAERLGDRQNQGLRGVIFDASMRGTWIRLRFHFKISENAIIEVWRDDEKIGGDPTQPWDMIGYPPENPPGLNYFRNGYLMGWSNSGFDEDTYFYIDDLKVYTSDPGW